MECIRKLDPKLANQIAAGEVVERPASVVKELVENALDAGATRIEVEIVEAGLRRITVRDDGIGMSQADACLALERHATSKIGAIEDLLDLKSFGFRGEALPSIASVSNFRLTTRRRDDAEATTVRTKTGAPLEVAPDGAPPGTTIEVEDLFEEVPARKKFLKSAITENAHIADAVFYAALARPDVTFVLKREQKVAREYLRARDLAERVGQALPHESLVPITFERGPLRVEAFLSGPERASRGPTSLHLFVNQRPIRDRAVARAVAHAYGSLLESGRYPVGVVYLSVPPAQVDVNVHPQKAEVRFQDARALFDAIARGLGAELSRTLTVPGSGKPTPYAFSHRATAGEGPFQTIRDASTAALFTPFEAPAETRPFVSPPSGAEAPEEANLFRAVKFYASLKYLRQLKNAYLLCEGKDALYILDQHAACERVLSHRLRTSFAARTVVSQRLLTPESLTVSEAEADLVEAYAEGLSTSGIEVSRTGPRTISLHSIPAILWRKASGDLLRAVLADLVLESARQGAEAQSSGRSSLGRAIDLVHATMACHGSYRAGDVMADEEVQALLAELDGVDFAGYCPHGRPILKRVSYDDIERSVGR
ncbi:MAG: DNA mismatch repair endonuclease MutL [Polyangiaceae bacterium]